MTRIQYPFAFTEDDQREVKGILELEAATPYQTNLEVTPLYRPGRLLLDDGQVLELVLYHNPFTAEFIYLRSSKYDRNLLTLAGMHEGEVNTETRLTLPGQLCMGADRARLIGMAMFHLFAAPPLTKTIRTYKQHNLAIFPIAREGLKYMVGEAIFENFGYYCDEILLDAHHVFDISVPVYSRKVELGLFKDKDLDKEQHENVKVAFIADGIASGLVMKEVIIRVNEHFNRLERVEVVAPLATIRGLCRLAGSGGENKLRVHVFETLLNALPPDYYYSAHFNQPELHIRPDLEAEYRAWWGEDDNGIAIADTACAGYGWSEVFYSPRKQIEMMNGELGSRHHMTIADIIRRRLM